MVHQYIQQALRIVRRNPAYSLGVVLTLGIGIGMNTSIFAMVDAMLNRPIDFPQQERLISVLERRPKGSVSWSTTSVATYSDWRRSSSFESMAAYEWWDTNMTGAGEPTAVKGYRVTPEFFRVLGVQAALGRVFSKEDAGAGGTVVLSHGLWQRMFQGSESALGSMIQLDGTKYTIIGVMPANFNFPAGGTELWAPAVFSIAQQADRKSRFLSVVGRLKPDASLEQARTDLSLISSRIAQQNPETNRGWGVIVQPLRDLVVGEIRPFVLLVTGIVAFVLLIACVNVAILQLSRSMSRGLEVATRASLGATRGKIIQQLLVESIVISILGGIAALAVGQIGIILIRQNMPVELAKWLPGWSGVGLNWTVFLFTLAVSVFCGIVSGLAPALQLSRTDLSLGLKGSGHSVSRGRESRRWRKVLVVAEVVLAVTLLVGVAVMVNAFDALLKGNQPFEPDELLAIHLVLPESRYDSPEKTSYFYSTLLEKIASLPQVESVAAVNFMPFAQLNGSTMYSVEGDTEEVASPRNANYRSITPNYFETLHLSLKQGRAFSEADGRENARVAIVSERLAARCWPNQNPLGKRLKAGDVSSDEPWMTVVGVVTDVRHSWLDKEIRPTLYVPLAQVPRRRMDILARVDGHPITVAPAIKRAVAEIDRNQPIHALRTMDTAIREVMLGLRFVVVLMMVAGGVSLLLATIGIYSVTSYQVRERSKELGIRIALGAAPKQILRLVIAQGLRLTAVGMVIGGLAGIGLAKLMASLLYGVQVFDPLSLSSILISLALIAIIASYLPARSLAASNPITTLRQE